MGPLKPQVRSHSVASSEWFGAYAMMHRAASKGQKSIHLRHVERHSQYKTSQNSHQTSEPVSTTHFLNHNFTVFSVSNSNMNFTANRYSSSTKHITHEVIHARVAFLRTRHWHLCLAYSFKIQQHSNNLRWHGLQTGPWLLGTNSS